MSEGPFRPRGGDDGGRLPGEDPRLAGEDPPSAPEEPLGPRPGPPPAPRTAPAATWILGIALVLGLGWITVNTIRTDEPGSRGVAAGDPLPPFAAPLVDGGPEGDAQVDPDRACAVRGDGILNSCELREEAPAALAFIASRSAQCDDQVDVLERVGADFPDVDLAVVAIRGTRQEAADVARRRGWRMPVAWDRDGAVANLFAVAVCPTVTFVGSDGRVAATTLGLAGAGEIRERLEALE